MYAGSIRSRQAAVSTKAGSSKRQGILALAAGALADTPKPELKVPLLLLPPSHRASCGTLYNAYTCLVPGSHLASLTGGRLDAPEMIRSPLFAERLLTF